MRRRQFAYDVVSRVGLMVAAVIVLVMATQRAEAVSLASPLAVPVTKAAADGLATGVRYGSHGGGFHGGGFRGGGFRGGGAAFHRGGGFRGGGVAFHRGYRYGGFHRYYGGGYRYAYHRPYFHRRHFHRGFYYGPSYSYPRRCRVIWTHYGPRRICRPWWHRHHHWRTYW